MDAGFEFETLEDVAAGDLGDRLLVAADAGIRDLDHLEAPALQHGVALVHAEELGGEQRRLLAAGAGADLEDGVLLVGLVLGQEHGLHIFVERQKALPHGVEFAFREFAHLGVVAADQGFELGLFGLGLAQIVDAFDDRRQLAVFLGELDEFA